MKSLIYYSILIVNLILAQLLLIYTIQTTEVDLIPTPETKEEHPHPETEDEPSFSFDDSTFYKIVWTTHVPAVTAALSSSSASKTSTPSSETSSPSPKTSSPSLKTSSSSLKTSSPSLKTTSPSLKTSSPALKTSSPVPISSPAAITVSSSKDKPKDKDKDKQNHENDKETEVKVYDKSDKERKNEHFEEVIMTSPNKEYYRCLIPILNKPKEKAAEEEAKVISKNPYTVLKALFTKKFCSYRVETFWTYEICHGYHIRQYHDDARNKDNNQEYYLGKFNQADLEKYEKDYELNERSKKLPTVNVFDFTMPYISVNMTDGTLCDLSKTKRTAKVLYVCVEDSLHDLYSIKETSTCEYEVITFSSLLCEVPEFRMKISQENDIKCYPLNDSPQVPTGFDILNKTSK